MMLGRVTLAPGGGRWPFLEAAGQAGGWATVALGRPRCCPVQFSCFLEWEGGDRRGCREEPGVPGAY